MLTIWFREVSKRLHHVLRACDAVGRYGGEEFLIILPGCERSNAVPVAERLRNAIAAVPIATSAGVLSTTISLGVATSDRIQRLSVERLISTADQALYRAKGLGRNRTEVMD